jgi:hypothetical protein
MLRGVCFVLLLVSVIPCSAQAPQKRLLAWADTTTGYQHDFISHTLAVIERLDRESGNFEICIRTGSQPFLPPARHTDSLNNFDATFFIYQQKDFSRDRVHALTLLDGIQAGSDESHSPSHRSRFPVAWTKMYGQGPRVLLQLR